MGGGTSKKSSAGTAQDGGGKAPKAASTEAESADAAPAAAAPVEQAAAPTSGGGDMADQAAASAAKKAAAAAATADAPEGEGGEEENGHAPLAAKIATSAAAWSALNAKAAEPEVDMSWPLGLVADQDEASKIDGGWCSHIAYGRLIYNGKQGAASYALEMVGEAPLSTERGDKAGRGAEYSALEVFNGRLFTWCDRTGHMEELVPAGGFSFSISHALDSAGAPITLYLGDGGAKKPLKCEWSSVKGGVLHVGSTGKERTDDDGNVVHEGEMWIKRLTDDLSVENVDWRPTWKALREPCGYKYSIHEAVRWSDVHERWFFLPRKASREAYDEVKDYGKCINLMLAAADDLAPGGEAALPMQPYLTKSGVRGCSDFLFVPGSNDCHLLVFRTEEALDGAMTTYASVIDLEANVLMEEFSIGTNRKFEGAAWLGGFGPFPPPGPKATTTMAEPVAYSVAAPAAGEPEAAAAAPAEAPAEVPAEAPPND